MPELSDLEFLRAIAETRSFTNGQPQGIQLAADGSKVFFLRGLARKNELALFVFDVATGEERELASTESVLGGSRESLTPEELARRERMRITARGIVSYQLGRGGAFVLFMLGGRAFVLPLAEDAKPLEIAGPDESGAGIFDPRLSPDGKSCAFVRNGELWVVGFQIEPASDSPAIQLTHGATSTLTHGRAEFVAQEELARFRGYWWSPDSRALLYQEVDESEVERLYLQDPAHEFREPAAQAYPRPGKANAKWRFGIVAVPAEETAAQGTRWLAIDPRWEYVARVEWPAAEALLFIVLTRDQRELALLSFDAGNSRTLLRETDDAFLNAGRDLIWLPNQAGFLWSSDTSGELQLFRHAVDGAQIAALTAPEFRFTSVVGLDRAGGSVFVLRHASPISSELWELPLAKSEGGTSGGKKLAPVESPNDRANAEPQGLQAIFARKTRAHLLITAPPRGATRFEIFGADGARAGELRSVAEAPPFTPRIELAQVGKAPVLADGTAATDGGFHSLLVRPRYFVLNEKYPLIVQVYGGPHVNTVKPSANSFALDQWIADHGFIVLRADNRGTPLRGRAWERSIQGRFADVPLEDQVAAVLGWAKREPAIDRERVGIIGHSFGGFLSALAVLRRPDIFKAAVAGAPVVEWRNYDTAYTERYLGVPPPEGDEVYARNGLLRYAAQEGATKRPLFISHGTADDNVHFSESLLLADALFRAGKPFELLPQLGQTHQFHSPELMVRYWEKIFSFFHRNL